MACNRPCSARSWRIPALLEVRAGVPQPETEKERSPIDFPQVRSLRNSNTSCVPAVGLFRLFAGHPDAMTV